MITQPKFRVMVVIDTDTHQEVYGQVIHDDYLADEDDIVPSTDEVVRAYMQEFCTGCYTRNNRLHDGPLTNDFDGRVVTVAEEAGMKEYHVVVKVLERPRDEREIWNYTSKDYNEWRPAAAAYRGEEDTRRLDEDGVSLATEQDEWWWKTFKYAISCVTLAMVLTLVVGTLASNNRRD